MNLSHFKWEVREIALKSEESAEYGFLTIDSPPVNALSSAVLDELSLVLDEIEKKELGAFIFTGAGKAFIAGADISEMKDMSPAEAEQFSKKGQAVFERLETLDAVSIAAVNGFALGGGLELALACDMRFLAESAQLGLPEVSLGLIPGFGGTQRLARETGRATANYIILSGEKVPAREAALMGLAQKVVSDVELEPSAVSYVKKLLHMGPNAVKNAKRAIDEGIKDSANGYNNEAASFGRLFDHPQTAEGLNAFLEKRTARFRSVE